MAAPASPTIDPTTDKPPRPRCWIPVSLRLFAAILVLLGVAGAWRGVTAYQQLAAIREVERLGGRVSEERIGTTWLRELVGEERMRGFDNVIAVGVDTEATDAMLSHISGFTNLQSLWVRNTQVTDAGLVHLRGLSSLERLNLAKTKVSADGLASLAAQAKLRVLWLDDTQASDVGRQHLVKLTGLKWLVIDKEVGKDKYSDLDLLQIRSLELMWMIPEISILDERLTDLQSDRIMFMPQLAVTRLHPKG